MTSLEEKLRVWTAPRRGLPVRLPIEIERRDAVLGTEAPVTLGLAFGCLAANHPARGIQILDGAANDEQADQRLLAFDRPRVGVTGRLVLVLTRAEHESPWPESAPTGEHEAVNFALVSVERYARAGLQPQQADPAPVVPKESERLRRHAGSERDPGQPGAPRGGGHVRSSIIHRRSPVVSRNEWQGRHACGIRKEPQIVNVMDPILGLAINLPPRGSRDVLRALHAQLRAAILEGRLRPGLPLPATRALATALGVSRNTAVAAYDLLLSEGYLVARPGAGTYVADILPRLARSSASVDNSGADFRLAPFWRSPPAWPSASFGAPCRFDFRVGLPDKAAFPFQIWRRLSARALRALSRTQAAYAEPDGRPALRDAIAKHVSFVRAVAVQADDLVVTAGAQQAFDLLARILVTPGRTVVAVEDPGYPPLRAAFAAAGANLMAVPVDDEGLLVERLPAGTRVVCVTPSHQFPLGYAMSLSRRAALLDFAHAHGAVVIEDDYDGEFRYAGRPLDALQTLDRSGSVFYVGTFSKSLFPALRLGFVVVPPWARPALVAAKRLSDWHGPILAQDTLAAFIAEGHLARHIRKMRKIYGERRTTLIEAIARHCGDLLEPIPADSGLHLAATVAVPLRSTALVARAAEAGIGLYGLDRYAATEPTLNGLAFGYGMIEADRIDVAIGRLAELMRGRTVRATRKVAYRGEQKR